MKLKILVTFLIAMIVVPLLTGCGRDVPPGTTVLVLRPRGNPIIKKETHLQAYESKDLDGRIMNYDLTRFLKGKNIAYKPQNLSNLAVEIRAIDLLKKRGDENKIKEY